MKKIYSLILTIFVLSFGASSQILEDDFEFYTLGDMGLQNSTVWSTWSGTLDDGSNIIIVDDIAVGAQAGYMGPDSTQDCILLLGNETAGDYSLLFQMYITAGSTGYFNVQGETEDGGAGAGGDGVFNSSNMYFNNAGDAPGVFEDETTGETGTYPEDEWFSVFFYFDLEALTYEITINGVLISASPVAFQTDSTLGGINFFSIDADNNYWIDDVSFIEGEYVGIDDNEVINFSVYPNPVSDVLNINSSSVVEEIAIYDQLGKLVLQSTPNVISPSLDIRGLNSGVLFVSVIIDGTSKTVKVIK